MEVLFEQAQVTSRGFQEKDHVYFDKKDELLQWEGYCSLPFFISCFKEIVYKSIPRIFGFLFNLMTLSLINIYILGQRGITKDLLIFGLGDVWSRIVSYSIIRYKNMTLQIEASIAFSCKNYVLVGAYYQRSLFIVGLITLIAGPFLCFWWKALIILGIDKEIAQGVGDFMWVSLLSVFAYGYYDTTNNYLQAQNVLYPQMGIQILKCVCHYFIALYLINEQNMGVLGAAWTKCFSDLIAALLIYAFITIKRPTRRTWIEWDKRAFDGIIWYIQNSIRNGSGPYLEESALMLLTMIAMYLPDATETVTHIAFLNSGLFHFSFFLGIQYCVTNFVGSSVRHGHIKRAKRRAFMSLIISCILVGCCLFVLLNNKIQWSEYFSVNPVVQEKLQGSVKLYALILGVDGIQLTLCAILKALDRFKAISIVYGISYYGIGLFSSIYFSYYRNLYEIGIWRGWLISSALSGFIFIILIFCSDWRKQHLTIKQRLLKYQILQEMTKK